MKHGLLCGLKAQRDAIDSRIWALFTQMQNSSMEIDCIEEIVTRAIEGGIDLDREFNLPAYVAAIHRNSDRKSYRKLTKETFIDFHGEREAAEDSSAMGGMSIDVVSYQADALSEAKSEFEMLFDNEELMYAINTVKDLNNDFVVEYSIDLIGLIKKAVQGIPQAVVKLKEVCDSVEVVAEQVKIILSSGVSVDTCFAD